jgi:UPF0716 family protein affecting phage T7 exclusion
MNMKTKSIIGWVLSGIVFLLMAASAADKISGSAHSLQMTQSFGIAPDTYRLLGIIELISAILFLIPRTGILGLLLLTSYVGGAIATHLQHGQSIIFPAAIEALVWIAAVIRFTELWQRIGNRRS